VYFVTAIMT